MSDNPLTPPAPARVAYTTSFLSSPQFIGFIVAALVMAAQHFGLTFLDSTEAQGLLSVAIGWALGAGGNWLFPSASGRLGLTSPMAWNAPAPQDVPVGNSLIKIPSIFAAGLGMETIVRPANDIGQMVRVAEVAAAVASAAQGVPVTVNVTPGNQPNEAVRISPSEQAAAPSVPRNVAPSPAPLAA